MVAEGALEEMKLGTDGGEGGHIGSRGSWIRRKEQPWTAALILGGAEHILGEQGHCGGRVPGEGKGATG